MCVGVYTYVCMCGSSYVVQCILQISCQQNLCSTERKRKKRLAKGTVERERVRRKGDGVLACTAVRCAQLIDPL